jgi:hypothetical protein
MSIIPASKVAKHQAATAIPLLRSTESRQDFYDRLKKAVDEYFEVIINTCRISIENATKTVSTTPGIIIIDQPCLTEPVQGINTSLLLYGKHIGGSKYDSGFLNKCNLPYPFERAKRELAKFGYRLSNISDVALKVSHDLSVKFQLEFDVEESLQKKPSEEHSSSAAPAAESASTPPRVRRPTPTKPATAAKPSVAPPAKKERETPEKSAETPEKSAETPAKPVETPAKPSAETPAKPVETPEKSAETSAKPVNYKTAIVNKHRPTHTSTPPKSISKDAFTRDLSISDEARNSITREHASEVYYNIVIAACEKGLLQKSRWESQKKFNVYDNVLSARIGNFYGLELLHGDESNVDEDKRVPSPLKKAQAYMEEKHKIRLTDDTDSSRSRKVHLGLAWD